MQTQLAGLGWRTELERELRAHGDPAPEPARVLAQYRDRWLIAGAGTAPRLVAARGRLRSSGGPPVAGDWVAVDAGGAICGVLARRGMVVRRDAGNATEAQVVGANVDLALVVESLPDPNPRRAERFAAVAAAGGVEVAFLLTKADLDDDAIATAARFAHAVGATEALMLSAVDRDGIAELRRLLTPGRTAILLGKSGVGKSTLANALLGEDRQATAPVRVSDGRGRHTTVVRELLLLPGGALLLDTPGMREVGLWDGIGKGFADVDELAAQCRFADCTHLGEPGCAVRDAVEPERLAAWRKLTREQAWVEDRRAAARARERRGRTYSRLQRADRIAKGRDE